MERVIDKHNKEHYFRSYDDITKFISYFYQIDIINKLTPNKILEVGIGNGTTAEYLKRKGFDLDTCDVDGSLKVDIKADIRDLPLGNNSYDLVAAFEVLEHMPFNDLDKALEEIERVSKKYVVISLPYAGAGFELIIKFPLLRKIVGQPFVSFLFRIPYFFLKIKMPKGHYWEMGRWGYSKNKIKRRLKKYFKIIGERRPVLNSYHYFFVLEKK